MELLAPLNGTFKSLSIAIDKGADAAYFGVSTQPRGIHYQFGLRPSFFDFRMEDVPKLVEMAHEGGVKIYAVLNYLMIQNRLDVAVELALELFGIGIDGLIVSDLGLISRLRELKPGAFLILSIEAGVCNRAAVEFYRDMGVNRIILERNLSTDEIAQLTKLGVEIEVFCFGGYCYSYHGWCGLSLYRTGHRCLLDCGWKYRVGDDKPGWWFYSMPLSALEVLPELKAAGVKGLKIEGRANSNLFVGHAVATVRKALDILEREGEVAYREALPEIEGDIRRAYKL
ncbi:MAG TPA: U32 family peptidase, partial [Proteobacteria bacterium]|nr:U32 family peptidase [Pseudomonadota bacterium]